MFIKMIQHPAQFAKIHIVQQAENPQYAVSGDEGVAYVEEHAENINKDVLAAYEKGKAKYKVLALTTCVSDSSNARTVIVPLID